ncbi:hypothetical protein FB384_004287 [Prauserella sediminis]|uniref:Copper transport outer membrane protein MctB n=1 Tax=Prauserella sediminis TaxID=577680 RepID=A0A839XVB8_9PSEU|nr:copper transporter [Prauserella sediminis]MBB3665334.1 hypothetical protein [Prauserella sediminis]
MISLRYHIVSIAAAFLALAIGVVLGSTALNGTLLSGLSDERGELAAKVSDLESQRNALEAQLADADEFTGSIGGSVVDGQLDKRSVVFITTPDASSADRDALTERVEQAGAEVTGEVQLTEAFTDPGQSDQLREIATRLQPSGAKFPTAGDPGTLAGALAGSVLLLDGKNAKPQASGDERQAALSGLTESGFVNPSEDSVKPAQLAIVLTGGEATGEGAGNKAATMARFAAQLDRSGAGAVLAGKEGSAGGSGAVGVARADTATTSVLTTVDNVGSHSGRIATVLALREQLEGDAGRYGTAGNAEAPAPGVDRENR